MASWDFDDSILHNEWSRGEIEASIYKSALFNAGVITVDADLAEKVGMNTGRVFTTHFYRELPDPNDDANTAGPVYPDDSDVDVPVVAMNSAEFTVTKNGPVVAFSKKSIIDRFNYLDDPLSGFTSQLQGYWSKYYDQYAIRTMSGVIADNVANDASDLLHDISNAAAAPDTTNTVQPQTVIDAESLKGDAGDFNVLVVHSKIFHSMRKQNLIDTIPASDGRVQFNLYQGKLLVVSDQVEVDMAGAYPVYTSYLCGSDCFRYGSNLAGVIALETYRDPKSGRGAGEDIVISRTQFALHPMGFSWLDTVVSGSASAGLAAPIYPNWSDLMDATNWDRSAATAKHIPWVAIRSNG